MPVVKITQLFGKVGQGLQMCINKRKTSPEK